MKDGRHIERAIAAALESERRGNLPIGAVIVLDGEVIAEGLNAVAVPHRHPGRHAEMEALARVPDHLWMRAREMTCYTTLEPCVMCFGALLLHGVGRIVFGARDPQGGSSVLLEHLPPYYAGPEWRPVIEGPVAQDECEPLFDRAYSRYVTLESERR
jgi:tRNA(adenine34) deaminase